MTRRDPIRFHLVIIDDRWGHATTERFLLDDNPRASGAAFSVCIVDDQSIAVFLDSSLTKEARNELASRRPDWLAEIVYADVATFDQQRAIINAAIGSPADTHLASCAFAAACVAFDAGTFNEAPSGYTVHFPKFATTFDLTITFDRDSESWYGEVSLSSSP